MNHSRTFVILTFLLAGFCLGAKAQGTAPAPAATASVYTFGGDLRSRNEYYDNAASLSDTVAGHEQDYFRVRARLWAGWTPAKTFSVNLRAAAEPRSWVRSTKTAQHDASGPEWKYVIFDAANVKWTTSVAGNPLTLTLGRQDIQFGDLWLVVEGSPSEGSFTFFFDAARATFELKEAKTKVDLAVLEQTSSPDDHLPVLGRKGTYSMVEEDQRGVIVYASNKSCAKLQADGYFIYKEDTPVLATGVDSQIHTLGARLVGAPAEHWQITAEAAVQWGEKRDPGVKVPVAATARRDVRAWGVLTKLSYLFKDGWSNQVNFHGEFLPADDPSTPERDEAIDVLWGRYPRWSEISNTAFIPEAGGRLGQYSNLIRVGADWSATPCKGLTCGASYMAMFAPESTPTRARNLALFSRDGHFRGHFVRATARRQFTKRLSAMLLAEAQSQGDYYAQHDTMTFFRGEVLVTF